MTSYFLENLGCPLRGLISVDAEVSWMQLKAVNLLGAGPTPVLGS